MKKQSFKTTINCSKCVNIVSKFLNEVEGISSWEVNTEHPDKVLSIIGYAKSNEVIKSIEKAGFEVKLLEEIS